VPLSIADVAGKVTAKLSDPLQAESFLPSRQQREAQGIRHRRTVQSGCPFCFPFWASKKEYINKKRL